jgi:hypothetical protein
MRQNWSRKRETDNPPKVQTTGAVIPNNIPGTSKDEEPISISDLVQPVKFDGIAIWELTSLAAFEEGLKDDYYVNTILPDEANFLDKEGLGGGVVARYHGKVWSVIEKGKNVVKTAGAGKQEMEIWDNLAKRYDLVDMQGDGPY